jgi:hypothetical protein
LFQCEVPLASLFMCNRYADLKSGLPVEDSANAASDAADGDFQGAARNTQRARETRTRLANQQGAMRDLKEVELPQVQLLMALSKGRFTTIRAEATLPIHGATYYARTL